MTEKPRRSRVRMELVKKFKALYESGQYKIDPESLAEAILDKAGEPGFKVPTPILSIHPHEDGREILFSWRNRRPLAWLSNESRKDSQAFHDPNSGITHIGIPMTSEEKLEFERLLWEKYPRKNPKKHR